MHAAVPDAKLIFMLRNPIERSWSAVRYRLTKEQRGQIIKDNKRLGAIEDLTVDQLREYIAAPALAKRSDYLSTIDRFRKHYPAKQMQIVFFDAVDTLKPTVCGSALKVFLEADLKP